MQTVNLLGIDLQLLPEKAIYIESLNSLLVSDVHLGKAETFQSFGVPVPTRLNQVTLDRLQALCLRYQPETVFVLGDLFHSAFALVDEVLEPWFAFLSAIESQVQLIVGNHDRALVPKLTQLSIHCVPDAVRLKQLVLSHEPHPQPGCLNICGHVHPCVRLKTRLDSLRLPCFYLEHHKNLLILPSFGEFTGGYEVELKQNATAYVVVENSVLAFAPT